MTVRVYLDSCTVIYLVEQKKPWCLDIADRLMPKTGPLPLVHFSDLTRLECRVGPMLKSDLIALAEYDDFFAAPGFSLISLDQAVFDLATELRARHRLKTPDALHLAAAIHCGCDEIWTNDTRLSNAPEDRLRIERLLAINE